MDNIKNSIYKTLTESLFGQQLLQFEQETINHFSQNFYGQIGLSLGFPQIGIRPNIISSSWFIDYQSSIHIINHENIFKQNQQIKSLTSALSPNLSKNLVVSLLPSQLPFQNRAIDFIVASHVLDTNENPEEICRELVRVLNAEGVLIITMFNPKSLIGIPKKANWIKPYLSIDWSKLNAKRVSEWLRVLGLEVEQAKFGIYLPSWYKQPKILSLNASSNIIGNIRLIGERWFASMGAVYILMARKRVFLPHVKSRKQQMKLIIGKPSTASAKI